MSKKGRMDLMTKVLRKRSVFMTPNYSSKIGPETVIYIPCERIYDDRST